MKPWNHSDVTHVSFAKYDFEKYDFSRNLLFCGNVWVGKTYTAREILNTYKNLDKHPKLWTYEVSDAHFKQLVKSNLLVLRKPEDYSTDLENYPLEMMLRVDVLLYDDLGVSDTSEAYLRDVTYILDERIKKQRRTIFTTNLKQSELRERLNDRIVSRVLYNCDVIGMMWDDRRMTTTQYFSYFETHGRKSHQKRPKMDS